MGMLMRAVAARGLALVLGLAMAGVALAQSPTGGPTTAPADAKVYFIDLKDGATIGPDRLVHFGLTHMGVAPAGTEKANTGHHHLLIDTDLPPLNEPIPADENHLHFGGGQTETVLSLSPGPHTLQLLLGDKDHIPHNPPVMSERIHITVASAAPAAAPDTSGVHKSPADAKVYIISPADGSYVSSQLLVRFGLSKMGIAPAGMDKVNTGHHHLLIDTPLPPLNEPIPADDNHLHFGAGQTEATIELSPGKHTLQLLLGDANHLPHDPPVYSQPITVIVGSPPPVVRKRSVRLPHHRG